MNKIIESGEFRGLVKKACAYKFKNKDWSDWGLLFRFLIIICKLLENKTRDKKSPRKISAWQIFLGEQMRIGKTIKEVAELWKIKKTDK